MNVANDLLLITREEERLLVTIVLALALMGLTAAVKGAVSYYIESTEKTRHAIAKELNLRLANEEAIELASQLLGNDIIRINNNSFSYGSGVTKPNIGKDQKSATWNDWTQSTIFSGYKPARRQLQTCIGKRNGGLLPDGGLVPRTASEQLQNSLRTASEEENRIRTESDQNQNQNQKNRLRRTESEEQNQKNRIRRTASEEQKQDIIRTISRNITYSEQNIFRTEQTRPEQTQKNIT